VRHTDGYVTSLVFGVIRWSLPRAESAVFADGGDGKAGDYGWKIGLAWWLLGTSWQQDILLTLSLFRGKVVIDKDRTAKVMKHWLLNVRRAQVDGRGLPALA